jgi:GNAT superfamily N-acetyltransferase
LPARTPAEICRAAACSACPSSGHTSGNLYVAGDYRRRRAGTWLLGQAADWLRLAQVTRLLDYASLATGPDGRDNAGYRAFLAASHFSELTRTRRGWTRNPESPGR